MFDAKSYLQDRAINFITQGKNVSPGWINISCPLCPSPDPSHHGGFSPTGGYSCWRCGWHPIEKVIQAIERISYSDACKIQLQYQTDIQPTIIIDKPRLSGRLQLPIGSQKMNKFHKEYLKGRDFDPDELEKKYHLLGTGPASDLPHRIIIPILYKGQIISWQSRAISDRAELRYISASPDREEVFHKDLLYNLDNCRGREVLVVEGITDVWRLGDGCCATFGTKFTMAQVRLLAGFYRVVVIYDPEAEAQGQARRMGRMLASLGVQVENVTLGGGDPGDLPQEEADRLRAELLGGE